MSDTIAVEYSEPNRRRAILGRIAAGFGGCVILVSVISAIIISVSEKSSTENDSTASVSVAPGFDLCRIAGAGAGAGAALWYPDNASKSYLVNFNAMTRQPNFVVYQIPLISSNNTNSGWLTGDPYNLQVLNPTCYNSAAGEYDNGHLVPNTAFGRATYYMANAVPMRKGFNRGSWRVLEDRVRAVYPGKLITIGCRYVGDFANVTNLRGCAPPVQVPSGCYYAVLDISGTWEEPGELLDSGYYANVAGSSREERRPPWIEC